MLEAAKIIRRIPSMNGDEGARHVVAVMRLLILEDIGRHDTQTDALAAALCVQAKQRNERSEWMRRQRALYEVLRRNYRFKADPKDREAIKTPDRQAKEILAQGYAEGDCDDRATLAAALLIRMGQPAYLILISQMEGVAFHHVFYGSANPHDAPAASSSGTVIPFDPQENVPPGRWPKWAKRQVFRV